MPRNTTVADASSDRTFGPNPQTRIKPRASARTSARAVQGEGGKDITQRNARFHLRFGCYSRLQKRIHHESLSHVLYEIGRLLTVAQLLVCVDAGFPTWRGCELFLREVPFFVGRHLYVHTALGH